VSAWLFTLESKERAISFKASRAKARTFGATPALRTAGRARSALGRALPLQTSNGFERDRAAAGLARRVLYQGETPQAGSSAMRQFENQVVLITGGANGIGRATAEAFAREGARVVVSDLADAAGEETVAAIRKAGGEARYVRTDVRDATQIAALVEGTVRAYGRLDVAFNNAGIEGTSAAIADLPEEDWERVLRVNLTAAFLCMKHELAQMKKQGGGAIVNNASILGQVGFANASAYVAAKHGLLGLTRCAALEYASQGIRVNAVCPGFIVTPMLDRAGLLKDEAARSAIESLHAMKRMGQPAEVAEAVLFLASSKASFIAGHPLLVDGGYVAQ
jgi:NAD(P)-dependent dehydrogenase (short-subunit alcohol dehydrogenase family)